MISASKITFSHYNLKILSPEVTKLVRIFVRRFVNFDPETLAVHILAKF